MSVNPTDVWVGGGGLESPMHYDAGASASPSMETWKWSLSLESFGWCRCGADVEGTGSEPEAHGISRC